MVDLSNAKWFKGSRRGGDQACVEVAFLSNDLVGVRDQKNRFGPALLFTSAIDYAAQCSSLVMTE